MTDAALRELFANQAHASWAGWVNYLFSISTTTPDGVVVIPKKTAMRWRRQMQTHYIDLPEEEKESDRKEVDEYLALLPKTVSCQVPDEMRQLIRQELRYMPNDIEDRIREWLNGLEKDND